MGKTTVSNMFRDFGVPVWCADNEVSMLYSKNGEATKIFTKEFPSVVTDMGVDKTKLRNLLHNNNSLLRKIEEIVHPLLRRSKNSFSKLNRKQPVIIYDIPLLFEKNQERKFDAVILVTASEMTQKTRVLKRKGITEKDFQFIKRNQLNETEKLKRANFIIDTDKPLLETRDDVKDLYKKIKEMRL